MSITRIGILTVSDRVSEGKYKDLSGPEVKKTLNDYLKTKWQDVYYIVRDNFSEIKKHLIQLTDKDNCCLVFTTGGTGPAPRDITPEVTEAVCSRMMPGFGELMRMASLKYVPTAILSRQTAGIRGNSLIINLPGKPKAVRECMDAVFPAVPYCLDLIGGDYLKVNPEIIKAFRPKNT